MNKHSWQRLRSWLIEHKAIEEAVSTPEQVTRLDLSNLGIEELPENFGVLSSLISLNLSKNCLKSLPKSMAKLSALSNLDLRRNDFEVLPDVLADMPLRSLNASGNRLNDVFVLRNCQVLRVLDLSGNSLSEIIDCINEENELRTLNLSSNFIKAVDGLFPSLRHLQRLNLNGNILNELPRSIAAMVELEEIEVCDNRLDKINDAFFSLNINRADLSSNRLRSLHLHALLNLEELVLDENPLNILSIDDDFAPYLKVLSCDSCLLDEFVLPPSVHLQTLCYSSNTLCKVPEAIGRYSALNELDIDGNTIAELPDALANLSYLQTLYVMGNPLSMKAKKIIAILNPEICDLNMKTDITIEKATPNDFTQMAELLSVLFTIETDFTIDFDKQYKGIKRLYEYEGSELLVARHEGSVVAMVTMQRLISSAEGDFVGQIEDLVVKEGYRKMGVGSRLLNKMRSIAQEYGYKRIQLAADVDNANALGFYTRRGFRRTNLSIYHYNV